MKRLSILAIALLIIFGCQQEAITGYVGQQFLLKADVPDEVGSFDYIWKITDLPEASELTLSDIQFSEDESQAIFVPDVAGHYTLQVTVWKYNDKLGAIGYTYDILENEPALENKVAENDAWLNETVDEKDETSTMPIEQMEDEEPIVKDVEKTEGTIAPPPPEATTDAKLTIQVAAESNLEAAQQSVNNYKMAGFDAYIQEVTTASNSVMYRVRIGKYITREEADQDAKRLELEYGLSPWITKYQK